MIKYLRPIVLQKTIQLKFTATEILVPTLNKGLEESIRGLKVVYAASAHWLQEKVGPESSGFKACLP